MSWKICIRIPPPINKEICFHIPVLIKRIPDFIEPNPWISRGLIDQGLVKDLPILATMDAMASQLSNATLRRTVQGALQNAVKQPSQKDVRIDFKA